MAARVTRRMIYPTLLEVGERDPALVARVVNGVISGQLNVIGEVFVADSAVETRISDPRIGPQSFLILQAIDENGRAVAFSWWLKERGTRYFVIGHDPLSSPGYLEYVVIG